MGGRNFMQRYPPWDIDEEGLNYGQGLRMLASVATLYGAGVGAVRGLVFSQSQTNSGYSTYPLSSSQSSRTEVLGSGTQSSGYSSGSVFHGDGQSQLVSPSVGQKRLRSSTLPRDQRYKRLRIGPVGGMSMQDETAEDLLGGPPPAGGSVQVPVQRPFTRLQQLAHDKRTAWLVRHNRRARARYLQSLYLPRRILLARLRRRRFIRNWVRKIRTRIGKKKRRR